MDQLCGLPADAVLCHSAQTGRNRDHVSHIVARREAETQQYCHGAFALVRPMMLSSQAAGKLPQTGTIGPRGHDEQFRLEAERD
jgi:hypothetical protein